MSEIYRTNTIYRFQEALPKSTFSENDETDDRKSAVGRSTYRQN
jgi:hypothetical protein